MVDDIPRFLDELCVRLDICLSPEGGQLLVDSGGERVEAEAYTTEVPTGTFDV